MTDYWVVQDKINKVERLVREDGAYGEHAEGTLLPWAKKVGLKLKKEVDDDSVREFSFSLTPEQKATTRTPDDHGFMGPPVVAEEQA